MTREEALKIVRENYPHFGTSEPWLDLEKALATLIPELRESEDERIRKGLVKMLTVASEAYLIESTGIKKDSYLAYLEQQKEQKPAQSEEEKEYVRTLKGLVSDFIRDSGGGITDVEYYQNICDWLDGRHIEQKPDIEICPHSIKSKSYKEKPAEWSEEDEWKRKELIQYLEEKGDYRTVWMTWLKSLRPSWKPSEEQMEALEYVIRDYREDSCNATANYLQEILDHLKNM